MLREQCVCVCVDGSLQPVCGAFPFTKHDKRHDGFVCVSGLCAGPPAGAYSVAMRSQVYRRKAQKPGDARRSPQRHSADARSPGPHGSTSHSERAGRGEVSRPGPPACGSPSAVISPHTFGWSVEEDAACLICRTCTRSASESCRARCRSRLRRFSAFLNSAATRFFSAFKSVCSFFRRSMLARRSLCWLPSEADAFPGVLAADTGEAADGRLARPGDGVLGAGGSPEAARASPAP